MLVINNSVVDAYFNLASEEYLLENSQDDVFMLWRNDRAVIVGKNQNTYAEVNLDYAQKTGLKIVRRLTGGGAVFHDPGNVNFTFITEAGEGGLDFSRFTAPIIDALGAMGVNACADGRNDIVADGCKISGNAQCVYDTADGRKRLMHHGTLLFGADMTELGAALRVSEDKLRSKGVKSVRSRVCNISALEGYCGPRDAEEFMLRLCELVAGELGEPRDFTEEERAAIKRLSDEKYSQWSWDFGASPACDRECRQRFPYGGVEVYLSADRGVIKHIDIKGDYFGTADTRELCLSLEGIPLEMGALTAELEGVGDYISGACAEDIARLILTGGEES